MKLRNKLWLSTLGLITLASTISLMATSCTTQPEDPVVKSYQHEYAKDMSMFLDKDKKTILKITNNGVTNSQSYGAFQDLNVNSPTYKGWYLLLRDKSKDNPEEEIIASFCGWNRAYLGLNDTQLVQTQTFSVPETIELPSNYSIEGLNTRTIEVRALGIDNEDKFEGYKEINDGLGVDGNLGKHLFFDPELKGSYINYWIEIFLPKKLDLSLTRIRYMFNFSLTGRWFNKISAHIIFPESLVYISRNAIDFFEPMKVIFDFSKTQLVELQYIYTKKQNSTPEHTGTVILPKSCVRLGRIGIHKIESINLENVLYYGDDTFSDSEFPNNTVKINRNAQYKKAPTSQLDEATFPPNVTIEYY